MLLPAAVLAQSITLGLADGSAAAGSTVSLPLTLSAPSGGGPAGVQWTITYPASVFSGINVSVGTAASGAGKSLDCVPGTGSYTCLLTGDNNLNRMQSGTVATVRLTVSSSASTQSASVQLTNAFAAAPDGTAMSVTATGGRISITGSAPTPSLASLTCSPTSLVVPASAACAVSLSGAAPAGGAPVSISTSSVNATVSAPSTVTVPSNATSANFQVSVSNCSSPQVVTVGAALNGTSRTVQLQVAPAQSISVSVTPASVVLAPGQKQQFSATVSGTTNGAVTWSASAGTITSGGLFTAPASASGAITVRATSVADPTKYGTATVTIGGGDTVPPVISAVSAAPGNGSAVITWTTNEPATTRVNYGTSSSSLSSVVNDTKLVTAHSITLTGLNPGVTYYYRVTSIDAAGNAAQWPGPASQPASFTVSSGSAGSSQTVSFWTDSARPQIIEDSDSKAVELGLKFQANVDGEVLGVRFYKGSRNTGTHVGNLWTSSGQKLATVTFSNETSSGWQKAYFSNPVAIKAGVTYVVSYHAPVGRYSASENFFTKTFTSGPLSAGTNAGVYRYGSSGFPTQTYRASNYWVDVIFRPSSGGSATPSAMTLLPNNAQPERIDYPDSSAVELGMRFSSAVGGKVLGIRFFRGPANGGVHTGSLWTSNGQKLASVVFSNETSSGWQTAYFSQPVTIQPGVTYVVSYYAPLGRYSITTGYFSRAVENSPLRAPVNAGVYRYGTSGFPNQTYQGCNYWVDVIFQPNTTAAASTHSSQDVYASVSGEMLALPGRRAPGRTS